MVEHASQRVFGFRVLERDLHCLADSDPQAAGGIGVLRQDGPPGLRLVAGTGGAGSAERLHHQSPAGFEIVAGPHHVDFDANPHEGPGHRQRAAPLTGAGLGGQPGDSFSFVVVGLGDGGIRLVTSHRADALVLVVDVRRCA